MMHRLELLVAGRKLASKVYLLLLKQQSRRVVALVLGWKQSTMLRHCRSSLDNAAPLSSVQVVTLFAVGQ